MNPNKQQCLIISDIINCDKQTEKGEEFEREMNLFKESVYRAIDGISLAGIISVIYLQFEFDARDLTGRSGKRIGRLNKKGKNISAYVEVTASEFDSRKEKGAQTYFLSELIEALGMIDRKPGMSDCGVLRLIDVLRLMRE